MGLSIPREARRAIAEGVQRGDAVAEMECLGVEVKTISVLEGADVMYLWQLMECRWTMHGDRKAFLDPDGEKIHHIGPVAWGQILGALRQYHELPERSEMFEFQW